MTEIRPELLRSIARQHIRDAVDNIDHGDVLDGLLTDARFAHLMVGDEDDDIATLDPIAAEIKDEIKAATVTTAWPDEQTGPTVGQLRHVVDGQAHRIQSGLDRIAQVEAERDGAYRERARLVALLAAQYPSHIGHTDASAPDWAVVTVELPTGQACWHVAPADMDLFAHVEPTPRYARGWDRHTTEEKYERIAKLVQVVEKTSGPRVLDGYEGGAE